LEQSEKTKEKPKYRLVWATVIALVVLAAAGYAAGVYKSRVTVSGLTGNTVNGTEKAADVLLPDTGAGPGSSDQKTHDDSAGVPRESAGESEKAALSPGTQVADADRRGWGLKPNDEHRQPEVPSSISSLLKKYGAHWIGRPDEKVLYLTFDEGYEAGYTPKILDVLKENGVPAAFFVTGHYVRSQPELVKRMVAEGHIVGNHTDSHPSLPEISNEEIEKELAAVEKEFSRVTGVKGMKYLRPPKGEYSERTLAFTRQLGYYNIFWSLALVDWVPMPGGPQEAYSTVMGRLHNGAVILLHAVSADNTAALDRIIKDAKAQGYTFKTLDDLVAG